MELETRQALANMAAARWALQYPNPRAQQAKIAKKLQALGNNPDPDAVDETIGNTSWTTPGWCNECGAKNIPVVVVGEPYDYESATAKVCETCLKKALSLFHS